MVRKKCIHWRTRDPSGAVSMRIFAKTMTPFCSFCEKLNEDALKMADWRANRLMLRRQLQLLEIKQKRCFLQCPGAEER